MSQCMVIVTMGTCPVFGGPNFIRLHRWWSCFFRGGTILLRSCLCEGEPSSIDWVNIPALGPFAVLDNEVPATMYRYSLSAGESEPLKNPIRCQRRWNLLLHLAAIASA